MSSSSFVDRVSPSTGLIRSQPFTRYFLIFVHVQIGILRGNLLSTCHSSPATFKLANLSFSTRPAGLVLKERLASLNVAGDEWQVERRLPRRIPICTWTNIRKYLVNGCDLINPVDGETLSTNEDELIQDLALSDKQMELMILEAKRDLELAKTQSVFTTVTQPEQVETIGTTTNSPDEFTNTVKELANSGLSPIEIKNELMKKYIIDATVPAIIKALKRQ